MSLLDSLGATIGTLMLIIANPERIIPLEFWHAIERFLRKLADFFIKPYTEITFDEFPSESYGRSRAYLLDGPPGTGKSTMIAAIANFLGYDIYDLELTAIKDNSKLRQSLIDISKRVVVVIKDMEVAKRRRNKVYGGLKRRIRRHLSGK